MARAPATPAAAAPAWAPAWSSDGSGCGPGDVARWHDGGGCHQCGIYKIMTSVKNGLEGLAIVEVVRCVFVDDETKWPIVGCVFVRRLRKEQVV